MQKDSAGTVEVIGSGVAAESAIKRAFREEIYSQAEALAQQVIAMYEQRRMNKVARYAETDINYIRRR